MTYVTYILDNRATEPASSRIFPRTQDQETSETCPINETRPIWAHREKLPSHTRGRRNMLFIGHNHSVRGQTLIMSALSTTKLTRATIASWGALPWGYDSGALRTYRICGRRWERCGAFF
ncbi:hypothetical protein AcV5_003166 [Taiwanofungus camphoratus]|nr:hypothetical protein AcV5_003166 [Antrodia cinnamomea]